jgi:hypothetical protein
MIVTVYTYLVTPLVIKSINTIHLNLIKVRHYNIKFQYLPEFTLRKLETFAGQLYDQNDFNAQL